MRFFISRLSALGDVVCTLPAAVALKRKYPDCEIVWAVDRRFAGIVQLCAAVDRPVIVAKNYLEQVKIIRGLGKFDLAFDLQGLAKSAWLVAWARAPKKLGYHWQREGSALVTQPVQPDPTSHHVVDQYVDVVRSVGAEMERAEFLLQPTGEDIAAMRELVGDGPLAILNPGAGWESKRWPPQHFAALADALMKEGIKTAFIGAAADRHAFEEVREFGAEGALDLTGKTSVRQLVALISLAQVHVGGDTGSSHIAAALGVPAVSLYSVTDPARSCPYGQMARAHYDPAGLANILPEVVLASAREALQERRP